MSFFATYMLSCEIQNDKIGPCQSKSVFTAFGLWEKIKSASYAVLCFVSSQLVVSSSWQWGLQSREQTIYYFFFWNFLAQREISWESLRFKEETLQKCNLGGW